MNILSPGQSAIDEIRAQRWPSILSWPDPFTQSLPGFRANNKHTISRVATLEGTGSFSNQPVQIQLSACEDGKPWMQCGATKWAIDARHISLGEHNIQLGGIKIIEHPLALMSALNLDINFLLSVPDFPTFDECCRPFLEASISCIQPLQALQKFTVKEPVQINFEQGYVILEPDDGNGFINIDHQIDYPGSSIGKQRIQFTLTPERFAYLCSARTPSFRPRAITTAIIDRIMAGTLTEFPVTLENVLFVDEERIYNPRKSFIFNNHNYEFISHEIIDVTAILKLIEIQMNATFCGQMTTHRFGHKEQIQAARIFCSNLDIFIKI